MTSESLDNGADTEPATDEDDYVPTSSRKRKAQKSAGMAMKYVDFISQLCLHGDLFCQAQAIPSYGSV